MTTSSGRLLTLFLLTILSSVMRADLLCSAGKSRQTNCVRDLVITLVTWWSAMQQLGELKSRKTFEGGNNGCAWHCGLSGRGLFCFFVFILSLEKVEAAVTNPLMVTILRSQLMSRAQQILSQRRRLVPANLQTHLLWLMITFPWSWTRFAPHTWNRKKDKLTKLTKFLFG